MFGSYVCSSTYLRKNNFSECMGKIGSIIRYLIISKPLSIKFYNTIQKYSSTRHLGSQFTYISSFVFIVRIIIYSIAYTAPFLNTKMCMLYCEKILIYNSFLEFSFPNLSFYRLSIINVLNGLDGNKVENI